MSQTEEQPKSPIFYVKLDSSVGVILGVCAPSQYQLNLKDVVITGFNEKCTFVTIVTYDPAVEKIDAVVQDVVANKRELVLLNIQDFFEQVPAAADSATEATETPSVAEPVAEPVMEEMD